MWFGLNHNDAYLSICAVLKIAKFETQQVQIESCDFHVINYLAQIMASLRGDLLPSALDMCQELPTSYRNQSVPM